MKGKGAALRLPDLSAVASPLTVQLRNRDTNACWQGLYSFPLAKKNDASQFYDTAE